MSSLEQIDQDYKLEPITQPQLDVGAIEIPEKGPMNFEMDVEVRPQFEIPSYAGLKVRRPVATLSDKHVDDQLKRFLEGHGHIVPKLEGAAAFGDYLTASLAFSGPDNEPLNKFEGDSVPPPAGDSLPGWRDRRCERAGGGQAR